MSKREIREAKNISDIIFGISRKNQYNLKYLKEDFVGVTTLGKQFKKYQATFLASLDSAVVRNFESLRNEVKEQLNPDKLVTIGFDELDDGDFKLEFNFLENEISKSMNSCSLRTLISGDSLILKIEKVDAEFFGISEISSLLNSYDGLSISLENFDDFVGKICRFISDLTYLYIHYLNNFVNKDDMNELRYKKEMITNFLNYLNEEIDREIFNNNVYKQIVKSSINFDKYIVSLTAYSPDKLNFLIFDYIYSPESEKFVLTNSLSSKSSETFKIKEFNSEKVIDFIKALKDDLANLFKDVVLDEVVTEEKQVKEGNIVFNLKSVNKETKEIVIEMNGIVYVYATKDSSKNIDAAEKEIRDILTKNPEDLMAYIENNLVQPEIKVIESKQVKEEKEESAEDQKDELKELEKELKDANKDGDKEEVKEIQGEIKALKDEMKPEKGKEEKEAEDKKEKKTEEKEIKDGDEKTKTLQTNMNTAVDNMEKDLKKEAANDIEMLDDENEKLEDAAPSIGVTAPSDINAFVKDDVGIIEPVPATSENIKEDEDEIMYMGDDEKEIEELFDAMDEVGNDKVIDFIVDRYDVNNDEDDILFADNYKEDLKVTAKDIVYEARGYKLIYNKEEKKVSLLRSKKNYTESKKTKKGKYQKEDSRTSDEIRDWETKNRINFQSNYAKPTRQKAFRNMYVEEKEIKENVKQFLESEKIQCELEDINFVNLKVFEESVKEKKMTFFEEIKDKVTNDIYIVGIFGDDSYCLVCKK